MIVLLCSSYIICSRQIGLSSKSDTLWESRFATAAVLQESWIPGCSLAYVTDGATPSESLHWMIENAGMESSTSVFEMSLPAGDVTAFLSADHFSFIDEVRRWSRCMTLIVVSDDASHLEFIVEGAIDNNALVWPTRLLVVTRVTLSDLQPLRKSLSNSNAMVVHLAKDSRRCGVYMYIPYSHRLILSASWTKTTDLTVFRDEQIFPDKFRRLRDGAKMTVAGNNLPPHVSIQEVTDERSEEKKFVFSGPVLQLLGILATNINFTYELRQSPDGAWGFLFPNGTWNGIIGMVLRKDIDFTLGPFGITYIRSKVIDYTNPLIVDYGQILGRRGDTEVDPWGFLMPLTPMIWAATFGTLFVIIVLSFIVTRVDQYVSAPLSKVPPYTYIRAFLQQNIVVPPDSGWEKVMLGSWLLCILVLLECYSTNLITLLAVRHVEEPYQYVKDIMDDPRVKMLWVANTAHAQYLANVDSGIFYEVAQAGKRGKIKFIPSPEYDTSVDEFVSRGDYVLMNPYLMMKIFLTEDYMEKGRCKFYVSKEKFLPLTFALIVPKNSPLRGPINEGIRAAVEGGLYYYWLENAFTNSKSCKNPPTKITVMSPLSFTNLWGMFVLLVGGYIISIVILCLEISSTKIRCLSKYYTY
ncbi:glutamate receptor ionotropic, kainate glr-3-like [Palaemon carinicauda]|uniref:glutamate receptor ionotropic, kainate glr-3-like n=1 Tax=Palaemon carinicauda TaxID=392227 RepID=UPI0035B6A373